MTRTPKRLLASAVLLAAGIAAAGEDAPIAPPAKNWVLPLFTKEGYRQMTLRGDFVRPVTTNRIEVTGLNVTMFSGGPDAKVDSIILSPEATFLINEREARGSQSVRLIRDDIEVTGEEWSYDYNEKKVLIASHAHVVFHAALPDILK